MSAATATPRPTRPRCRGRFRRAAKWVGLAASVLIAVVWVATLWGRVLIIRGSGPAGGTPAEWVSIENGCVVYQSVGRVRKIAAPVYSAMAYAAHPTEQWWWTAWVWWPGKKFAAVPLAVPLAVFAAATAVLFHSDRMAARRWCEEPCFKCGYNLRGLAPGATCPECGRADAPAQAAAR